MAKVRWGQCFLVDRDAARRIVDWAGIEGRRVVEVGPGRGALTDLLLERCATLDLVEIDPRLASALAAAHAGDPRVTVHQADAVRFDWSGRLEPGFTVVSNLPYESGTAIVSSLLAARASVREIVVMLQKEVVERLAAEPGSKTYGGLSVRVRMLADVEKGMVLAPRAFRPRPAVESRMVRIRPLAAPRHRLDDEAEFTPVVHAAFGQRRKMLRNSLGHWLDARFGEGAFERVAASAGVEPTARAEDVDLEGFAALVRGVVAEREDARERPGGGDARAS